MKHGFKYFSINDVNLLILYFAKYQYTSTSLATTGI